MSFIRIISRNQFCFWFRCLEISIHFFMKTKFFFKTTSTVIPKPDFDFQLCMFALELSRSDSNSTDVLTVVVQSFRVSRSTFTHHYNWIMGKKCPEVKFEWTWADSRRTMDGWMDGKALGNLILNLVIILFELIEWVALVAHKLRWYDNFWRLYNLHFEMS